jgi:hypothetical protein
LARKEIGRIWNNNITAKGNFGVITEKRKKEMTKKKEKGGFDVEGVDVSAREISIFLHLSRIEGSKTHPCLGLPLVPRS